MEGSNLELFQADVSRLITRAKALAGEACIISDYLRPEPLSWTPPQVEAPPASLEKRFAAWARRRERALGQAEALLRRLRATVIPRERELEIARANAQVAAAIAEVKRLLSPHFPAPGLGMVPEFRAAREAADAQLADAKKKLQIAYEERGRWEQKRSALERDAASTAETAQHQIPPALLNVQLGRLEAGVLRDLEHAASQCLETKAVHALRERAGVAGKATIELSQLEAAAQRRENAVESIREHLTTLETVLEAALRNSEVSIKVEADRLRGLSLDEKTGLPLVGQGLRCITEIFALKPPPTLLEGWGSPEKPFAGSAEAHAWFADTFKPVPKSSAWQLLNLWNPQSDISHLVVLGDYFVQACRCAALCASAHLRFGHRVRVFLPSAEAAAIFDHSATHEGYDVNLQQLYSGLGREPNADGRDRERLNAVYDISVVPELAIAPAPREAGATHLYVFLPAARLPKLPDLLSAPAGARAATFAPHAAPHAAVPEAVRILGIRVPGRGKLTREIFRKQLRRRVFLIPDEALTPSRVHRLQIPVTKRLLKFPRNPTLAQFEAHCAAGLPRSGKMQFARDADVENASAGAALLLRSVVRQDLENEITQVIYVGGDAPETSSEIAETLKRMFLERYGYREPDHGGQGGAEEARAVATCSSVLEWRRLMHMKQPPNILIIPRIQDPVLQHDILARKPRVGMLHVFTPSTYAYEHRRIMRQFSAVTTMMYDWPQQVLDAQRMLRPQPLHEGPTLHKLATQQAFNEPAVIRMNRNTQ